MANDIGSVKTALKLRLQSAAYTDLLQKIQDEFDDGVVLDAPFEVLDYERLAPPGGFPLIELIGEDGAVDLESSAQNLAHRILLQVTQIGDDEGVITKQVERYILAARRLFFQELLPGLLNFPVQCGSEQWSRLAAVPNLPAPFIKAGLVELTVPTVG